MVPAGPPMTSGLWLQGSMDAFWASVEEPGQAGLVGQQLNADDDSRGLLE